MNFRFFSTVTKDSGNTLVDGNAAGALIQKGQLVPIISGGSDFSEFAQGKAIYVDKTQLIVNLIRNVNKFIMFVRPRRMGKTLTLDIIANIYRGYRNIFEGTWIGKKENEAIWNAIGEYPVLKIVAPDYPRNGDLEGQWNEILKACAKNHGISIAGIDSPRGKLRELIEEVAKKRNHNEKQCVILVDEYDRPMTSCMATNPNPQTLENARVTTHNVYSALKDLDETGGPIKKCIFTGSAKFAKLSIFSGNDVYLC